ncbi:MAG: GH12 family glycosyl hydrolase domain-containing protein, partial [Solirubrobacteraceae bacterium]
GAQNPGPGCGPYRYRAITDSDGYDTYVLNDMWNPPGAGHPQTIHVDSPGAWTVSTDQARGNTAVLSYPDVQQILTTTHDAPAPLARFGAIASSFTETMPSGGDNEAAYDIWMGAGASTDYAQEVMIWVDDHRTNPPPGRIVGRLRLDGAAYAVWQDRSDGAAGFHTLYVVRDHNQAAGSVDVLAVLRWLMARRLTDATGVNQIDFGWEICSTDGRPETFAISRYSLRLRCRGGGRACYSS